MYQQYDQLEEASQDETLLISPHQEGVSPLAYGLPFQEYEYEAGQKPVDHRVTTNRSQRLLPQILSIAFVFVLYALALFNLGAGGILVIAIASTVVLAFLNGFLMARRH